MAESVLLVERSEGICRACPRRWKCWKITAFAFAVVALFCSMPQCARRRSTADYPQMKYP